MNIVKQFHHDTFVTKVYDTVEGWWIWGLGEDGKLYFQHSERSNIVWAPFAGSNLTYWLSIKDMEKIAKEFGHLLIFT